MGDAAFLRETELAILNAPFEGRGWHGAIDMISRACHSSAANMVGLGGPLGLSLNFFTGHNSELAGRYFASPELWGASNWRVNSAGGPMSIQHEVHYAAYRARARTSDYDDATADLDMPYGCQSPLISDSRNFLGVALLRRQREGPCDAETLARFGKLIRDLHRSVRVELALEGEAAELMVGEISERAAPMLLVDRFGCLCALSPAAEPLAEEDGPLRLCGLTVRLRQPEENRRFEQAMRWLLTSGFAAAGELFEMRAGRSEAQPQGRWLVRLVRLPNREHGLGFDPHLAISVKALPSGAAGLFGQQA